MDTLFEQLTQITKASAYDIVSDQVKELKYENEMLKIKLKGAEMRILALQEFINNVRPEGATPMQFPTL